MKFGMLHFFEHPAGGKSEHQIIGEQLDCMRAAEEMGFDSIWAPEHHSTEYGFSASPMVTLAAVASVTKRIRLGSGVLVLPFNDPIRVAEEAAMVDLMSDGRLDLGVGRGFQPVEYRGFTVEQSRSRDIFDEALDVIVRAWTEDPISFKGAHFDIPDQSVRPKPLQKPHPPIWVAAISDPSFEVAGARGFNLLCSLIYGFKSARLLQLLGDYGDALRSKGHNPDEREIGALCMVYCSDSTEQARRDFGGPVLWYYRNVASLVAPPLRQPPPVGYETYPGIRKAVQSVQWDELLSSGTLICGNPASCIRQIEELRTKYGFTQILCWTRLAGLEHRKVLRSMELMQTHVIPYFKRQAQERGTPRIGLRS
jgi:alkanesulfonate monooxygenase SsuD/methylene tetrahydromethanopterin reductase-like flavin-dependent oxidoreductase (luciferase family)